MKNKLFIILLSFFFSFSYGQKETNNWFFGEYGGLNFSTKTPTAQEGSLATLEGCAAISNDQGALLFYTDGSTIWNRNHEAMPNGTDLFGGSSSTQSAIIVPKPGDKNIYYVFTVDSPERKLSNIVPKGLNYSIVDMNLDNGQGDVIQESKNLHLITYNENDTEQSFWKCTEKISATIHDNGNSFWVLTFFVDTFYAFEIDENGINESAVQSRVNDVIPIVDWEDETQSIRTNGSAPGYLKLSPNGKKVAIAHSATARNRTSGKAFIYDFDNTTGTVSQNGQQLISGSYPYGVEFSPKSRKLYITTSTYETNRGVVQFAGSKLYQFNVESPNVASTRVEISSSGTLLAGGLQLALNGRIYRAKRLVGSFTGESSLAVIERPELEGKDVLYKSIGVNLLPGTYSNYGLPPFISSAFILTFDFEFLCFGDETHFYITSEDPYDTLVWDFGDGTTSTLEEPYHRYKEPGEYTVTLTTKFNGFTNKPLKKKIEIVGVPEVVDKPYDFIECDVDENSEDGITTFNLQLANDPITLGRGNEVDVFYYKDLELLNSDTLNIKALPNFYTNTVYGEPLFAKVYKAGSDCYTTAELVLKANKSIEFEQEKLYGCNLGDGTAEYDLGSLKAGIINDLGLLPSTVVSFHDNLENASLGYDAFEDIHIGPPLMAYIRIENENICYGIGQIELDMPVLPDIKLDEEFDVCSDDFPLIIDGGVALSERQNYTYEWLSGENTYELEARNEGEYYLTITDKLTLCSTVKSIKLNTVDTPIVKRVELEESLGTHSATVVLEREGDFEFALENPFGPYQKNPRFDNLPPDSYSVFVRDLNSCNLVEKKFFVFGFPKYFTPNSDGQTDVWEVKGLDPVDFEYSDIQIFNRFGKLLASIPPNGHWDGTYNGKMLPSDDYWFTITVTDPDNISTTYTKHFSLLRNE
ncbi:T9SS type B sorting domain-containing protein [Lutimonas zeaxanthinifaciens]|uniref:T9SS type B sorting domain-containing protein n=1 Tax=Lutimonas zeaxanthinifaciens TaxID=3060215 RepID=UPI00265D3617|nr:T9SS type B sorting domain-containing protein [Lutimonas sp. YSD2104]WKK65172.1 T9SS type B sorting domain-containing protein [Lutimonas sp. YSD2104]